MESEIEDLRCPLCLYFYDEQDRLPRMLPDCGHTFCSYCLQKLINEAGEGTLMCPEDKVPFFGSKRELSYFPKNFALLKVLEKKSKEKRETFDGFSKNSKNPFVSNNSDFLNNINVEERLSNGEKVRRTSIHFSKPTSNVGNIEGIKKMNSTNYDFGSSFKREKQSFQNNDRGNFEKSAILIEKSNQNIEKPFTTNEKNVSSIGNEKTEMISSEIKLNLIGDKYLNNERYSFLNERTTYNLEKNIPQIEKSNANEKPSEKPFDRLSNNYEKNDKYTANFEKFIYNNERRNSFHEKPSLANEKNENNSNKSVNQPFDTLSNTTEDFYPNLSRNQQKVFSNFELPILTESKELCPEHKKRLEIVCIDHKQKICVNCALFGSHKNHEIKNEDEVIRDISFRADRILEIIKKMDDQGEEWEEHDVDQIFKTFLTKSESFSNAINEKFNELKQFIKDLEKNMTEDFLTNFQKLESRLKIAKKVHDPQLKLNIKNWKEEAKLKLMIFSDKTDRNELCFEILDNPSSPTEDFIAKGLNISTQLSKLSSINLGELKNVIEEFQIDFNLEEAKNLIKKEFCRMKIPKDRLNFSYVFEKEDNPGEPRIRNTIDFRSKLSPSVLTSVEAQIRSVLPSDDEMLLSGLQTPSESSILSPPKPQKSIKFNNSMKPLPVPLVEVKEAQNSKKKSSMLIVLNKPRSQSRSPFRGGKKEEGGVGGGTGGVLAGGGKKEEVVGKKEEGGGRREESFARRDESFIKREDGMYRRDDSLIRKEREKEELNFKKGEGSRKGDESILGRSREYSPMEKEEKGLTRSSSQKKFQLFGMNLNEKFAKIINNLKQDALEIIDLTGAELGDTGVSYIAEYIACSRNARSLKLLKNKISDEGAGVLIKALSGNYFIHTVNLTQNMLTDKSMDSFAGLIKTNDTIKNLYLSLNSISALKCKNRIKEFKTLGTNVYI